jgi:proliferating cell nuclear antigen
MENSNSNYVLEIKTVQISPFRTLMTALKDILLETNITFQSDGIKIINMDKSHTILATLHLEAKNFEHFYCKYQKIVIGVNMLHFFKLINTIDNDDTLTIYIENHEYSDGVVSHLGLKFENGDIKQCKIQKLRLIEPEDDDLEVPWDNCKYQYIINLPSSDFQKIVRDLSNISDKVEIKSVGNELLFTCHGPFAQASIRRTESDGSMQFVQSNQSCKIVQGEFSLKNLGYFIKCTNLCNTIELYLENNLPMVIKYNVASLGEIRFASIPLPSN